MASLATHFSAFLFLIPVGTRRLLCSSSLYLTNPSHYRSRTWYFSDQKYKNIDLYTLIISLPIASFSHLFFFLAFSAGHPVYRFSFLNQSLLLSFFWVLIILILLKDCTDLLALIPDTFIFILAGVAFVVEYSFHNSNGIVGLGGLVYGILAGLAIVCAGCCFYLSIRPGAFFAEFLLSCGVILKGTWVMQVGLSLYTDAFGLKGCEKIGSVGGDVKCELEEDRLRGMAVINLVFIGHVCLVMIAGFVVFGVLYRNRNMRFGGDATGPLLAEIGSSDGMLMHPLPEFEIE